MNILRRATEIFRNFSILECRETNSLKTTALFNNDLSFQIPLFSRFNRPLVTLSNWNFLHGKVS